MSVYLCIPSCRPVAETEDCLQRWRSLGYKIAVLRQGEPVEADLLIPTGEYLGWARSTNILARHVLRCDRSATWIVAGGDDYWPVPDLEPETIGSNCAFHFSIPYTMNDGSWKGAPGTFGVMQPTGDRWGDSESARATYGADRGAVIDRIAGSPWMGREWCERAYLGNGLMWDGYHHLYADEELQEVATMQGVFWQRRDLTQYHNHPARANWDKPGGGKEYHEGHLEVINTPASWAVHMAMFNDRKSKGFPGSGVIGCR